MGHTSSSDTLTVTNLVAAYRSAYYSVYSEHPDDCEYIGDGYFYVDGKELHRIELLNAIRDLRHQAVQIAEAKVQRDSIRGRLFRLIKRLHQKHDEDDAKPTPQSEQMTSHLETNRSSEPSSSVYQKSHDTVRFNKGELATLRQSSHNFQTRPIGDDYEPPADNFLPVSPSEDHTLSDKAPVLVISVENVRMRVPIVSKVFFGRDIPQIGSTKVFDLTSFGGLRKGISRRHAEINLTFDNQLELVDLGSTNGTYLNYKKLKPLQAYPIHDGDHIRLGKVSIEIYFEHE